MLKSRLSNNGHTIIPLEILRRLSIDSGDELEFVLSGDQVLIRKFQRPNNTNRSIDPFIGYLSHLEGEDPDLLIEEMRGQ